MFTLASSLGRLYAGGLFTTAGGVGADRIAQWDGTSWSALGTGDGLNDEVLALAVLDGDVYAGGQFNGAGDVSLGYIAKREGFAWAGVGAGRNGFVRALIVKDGELYAGGTFGFGIAKWDGASWSPVGVGLAGYVNAFAVAGNDLYVGGAFYPAQGVATRGLARWDGHSWWPLGSGFAGEVWALAISGQRLYAGGSFELAGDHISTYAVAATLPDPAVWQDPVDWTADAGTSAGFSVVVSGTEPLSYQWHKDGTPVTGATANRYTIDEVQPGDAGRYTVVVRNAVGQATSAEALLEVPLLLSLREALDAPSLTWNTGGATPWRRQTEVTFDGVDAAGCGEIGPEQEAWVETTLNGPGTLRFWWRMAGRSDNWLVFSINGEPVRQISREEMQWEEVTCKLVDGPATLRWRVTRLRQAVWPALAWLDQVRFVPDAPPDLDPPPPSVTPCFAVAATPQPEFALSSASDGTGFAVGVRGRADSPHEVGVQRLTWSGLREAPLVRFGRMTDLPFSAPWLAFGTDSYLVLWADAAYSGQPQGRDVYGQRMSPEGGLLGDAFPVAVATGDEQVRGVAFDGSRFLAVWSGAAGFRGRFISPSGQLAPDDLVFTPDEVDEAATVAWGNGAYLVAWVEGPDGAHVTKGRIVSPAGDLGAVLTLSQNDSHHFNPVSIAYGGGRFLVVWHHNADEAADWDLRGRTVLPDGTMAGEEWVVADGPLDDLAWAGNVVFDGQHFLVVWTEFEGRPSTGQGTVRGRYWTTEGRPAGGPFVVAPAQTGQMGMGLCVGAGQVLTLINTSTFGPNADVCARFIVRPFVQIGRPGTRIVEVSYGGTLQSSVDLASWQDVIPQPASPWVPPADDESRFFRARATVAP